MTNTANIIVYWFLICAGFAVAIKLLFIVAERLTTIIVSTKLNIFKQFAEKEQEDKSDDRQTKKGS